MSKITYCSPYTFSFPFIESLTVIEEGSYVGGLISFSQEVGWAPNSLSVGYETSFEGYFRLLELYGITIASIGSEKYSAHRQYYWTATHIKHYNNSRSLAAV